MKSFLSEEDSDWKREWELYLLYKVACMNIFRFETELSCWFYHYMFFWFTTIRCLKAITIEFNVTIDELDIEYDYLNAELINIIYVDTQPCFEVAKIVYDPKHCVIVWKFDEFIGIFVKLYLQNWW